MGIALCGAVVAFVVFVVGEIFDLRGLNVVAAIILFVALAAGLFVGWDVNYMVARMRERADERADAAASTPAKPSEEAQSSSKVQPWIEEMRTRPRDGTPPNQ